MSRLKRSLLCAALVVGACECGDETDMERLREQVDTAKVHLWVASKVAFTKANSDDPTVVAARTQLVALMEAYQAARRPNAEAEAEAQAQAQAQAEADSTVSPSEALALAVALWELRESGARIVREDSEDELDPVLPVLLSARGAPESLTGRIDANTEHALLMLGLFVLKLHPKSPTPVPIEILLYEAMHIEPAELGFAGLEGPALAARSYLYANSDYCDLAKADSTALDQGETQQMADLMTELGGQELAAENARQMASGLQALGHGSTAICYLKREDEEQAAEELQAFVDAMERGGASPEDLGVIRAYQAYQKGDLSGTRAELERAKRSEHLDDDERAAIDDLIAQLDREETSALDAFFDGATLSRSLLAITWHEMESTGVLEALADAPVFRAVHDFVTGATGAVGRAAEVVDEAGEAAAEGAEGVVEGGRSLIESIFGD